MDTTDSTRLLPDWLTRCAENFPQRLALQDSRTRWSFADLHREAGHMAQQLVALGVREGDRVALLAGNSAAYAAFVHALTGLGAILVPLNTRLTLPELCWQLRDVRASLLVSDTQHADTAKAIEQALPELPRATLSVGAGVDADAGLGGLPRPLSPEDADAGLGGLPRPLSPEDADAGLGGLPRPFSPEVVDARLGSLPHPMPGNNAISRMQNETNITLRSLIDLDATQAIMYTSGTTGQPKGALITYGMQWWSAIGSALNLGLAPDDRWLACLPLFHIGGLSILMKSVIYGMGIIIHDSFDAESVNRSIREDGVTMISVVTVMLQRMLDALDSSEPGSSYPAALRCVLLGGGPAPYPLLEECARRSIPAVQTYGLTEACSQAVTLAPGDALRKLGSAGRPLLPVQLQIMRDEQPVPANEPGEIYLRGPTITLGYAGRPDDTVRAFHNGWLATGDIGYLDDEGYLYVLDRRADLIISGGENIYPAEIESALLSHPDVAEAGVCGQPDPQWGQVPIAFVQLRAGSAVTAEQLLAYLKPLLARYKLPRAIHLTGPLPRTSSGKLLRRTLNP